MASPSTQLGGFDASTGLRWKDRDMDEERLRDRSADWGTRDGAVPGARYQTVE